MNYWGACLGLCLALLLVSNVAGEVQTEPGGLCYLSWTPNTEPDLAGYKLYYGSGPEVMDGGLSPVTLAKDQIPVRCPDQAQAPLGKRYYIVTAFDFSGNESSPSDDAVNDIVANVPPPRPTAVAYTHVPFVPFGIRDDHRTESMSMVVAKPDTFVLSSSLTLLVRDPDFSDEGELVINGQHTIPLFAGHEGDDDSIMSIDIEVPASVWKHGENQLTFHYSRTFGYDVLSVGPVRFR